MNTIKQFVLAALLFLFMLPLSAHAQTTSMTITSPNGGEVYTVGDPVQITWNTTATSGCSLYYINEASGPFTSYYIGNVASASAGTFTWTAAVPNGSTGDQQQKIQIVCAGAPADYSDNYFTVRETTPPTCSLPAQVALADPNTAFIHAGESTTNAFIITNPNSPACGATLYGISQGYPAGWTMDVSALSTSINGGESESIPFTLTANSSASEGAYSYSLYAGDGNGGVLQEAQGYVTITPVCNLTVQAALANTVTPTINAGESATNQLVLTNPNPASCGTNTYLISRSIPGSWNMSIPTSVSVSGGTTQSVPFTITSALNAALGTYDYSFWIYNSWADGSGTAQTGGNITISDLVAPVVAITSPANNAQVLKNRTLTITASVTDNLGVDKVEFYVNGVLQCTDTTAAYSCAFLTANRKGVVYTLTAKAYDASGNTASTSVQVTTK